MIEAARTIVDLTENLILEQSLAAGRDKEITRWRWSASSGERRRTAMGDTHVPGFLGVTTSAVVRAARSKDLPGVEKYL